MNGWTVSLVVGAAICGSASATVVQIEVVGSVDFNGIRTGEFGNIPSGTPASMSFLVDSSNFTNGTFFPTRGYAIDQASFVLNIGGASAAMQQPYPSGETPYFVIRDNDPAVDGFLLASDPDAGWPNGVWTDSPARFDPTFHALFHATYGGDTLASLDIKQALGTYTFDGLTVFNWGLEDAGNQPLGLIFDSFTISAVPAPGAAALLGLAALAVRRRRHR